MNDLINKILEASKEVYLLSKEEELVQQEFEQNQFPSREDYQKVNKAVADLGSAKFKLCQLAIKYGEKLSES